MWCLSADEISSCIIHFWHIATHLCWEAQIGLVCSNPGYRLWRQWERAPYCLRVGKIHPLDAPECIDSDVIWHCWVFRVCKRRTPSSRWPSHSRWDPACVQVTLTTPLSWSRAISRFFLWWKFGLCSQPHTHTYTPHLSVGACGSQRPVFRVCPPSLVGFLQVVLPLLHCEDVSGLLWPRGGGTICNRFLAAALQPSWSQCIPALASILEEV